MRTLDVDLSRLYIRKLRGEDLPALEWEGLFRHYRNLYLKTYEEYLQGIRMMLVAEYNGNVIGQIFILFGTIESDPTPDRFTAYLYSLRVRPEFRNHGIGKQLILEAEKKILQKELSRVLIAVARENEDALRLYERLGYKRIGTDPGCWSYMDHQGQIQNVNEPSFILEKILTHRRRWSLFRW
ncbi:MAG: GNAT family N-acetyltransferase [Anaerolineales bacterium]|nr:GNAT family N-acetyltransferase [Anaerolineales bacterium]